MRRIDPVFSAHYAEIGATFHRTMALYIHQRKAWPHFTWEEETLAPILVEVRAMQHSLLGRMAALGFDLRDEANLATLTEDVLRTSEIEGEVLDPEKVRSSLARRLGLDVPGLVRSDRYVDGVVEMMLDATQEAGRKLTADRLFGWHAALFPTGRSGMHKIMVGQWRDDSSVPMQVVSGPMGRERVHYEAPAAKLLKKEMAAFIKWLNTGTMPGTGPERSLDPLIKAAVAHFWFVTLHPFEDGNGRIARALADLLLARSDGAPQRFYSMSAQIRNERKRYYAILESAQHGNLDITPWLVWFLTCLRSALQNSAQTLAAVLHKHQFWTTHARAILNPRQVAVLNRLLDGFTGKLTSSKWAILTKSSPDTALRDIQDLMKKGILEKGEEGGRSTNYVLGR